jgi:hypothetical protein
LFYSLFSNAEQWKKISPRAKHTKSKNDLNTALNHLQDFRKEVIGRELKEAQICLSAKECRLRKHMADDFLNKILNYDPKTTAADDELVLAVLAASFFKNPIIQGIF